jgi:hypothetical protein
MHADLTIGGKEYRVIADQASTTQPEGPRMVVHLRAPDGKYQPSMKTFMDWIRKGRCCWRG